MLFVIKSNLYFTVEHPSAGTVLPPVVWFVFGNPSAKNPLMSTAALTIAVHSSLSCDALLNIYVVPFFYVV